MIGGHFSFSHMCIRSGVIRIRNRGKLHVRDLNNRHAPVDFDFQAKAANTLSLCPNKIVLFSYLIIIVLCVPKSRKESGSWIIINKSNKLTRASSLLNALGILRQPNQVPLLAMINCYVLVCVCVCLYLLRFVPLIVHPTQRMFVLITEDIIVCIFFYSMFSCLRT